MENNLILEMFGIEPIHIILAIIALIILFIVLEFNRFTKLRNKIKQSKSGIDVYLNQRFDLIPNLVECVKGYSKYEQETLMKVTSLRTKYLESKELKVGEELNGNVKSILAVGEQVPELKSNEQFINLQKNLTKMESQLQAARRIYNGDVTLYNTTISTFPNNIFAKIFNFKEETLFEIDEFKKDNIKLDV